MSFIIEKILLTFMLVLLFGCNAEMLEELDEDTSGAENFCPTTRLANGLCPNSKKAHITSIEFTSADGSYPAGSEIFFKVKFNDIVEVSGAPRLLLETGTIDRHAQYVSGSGTKNLIFKYTSVSADSASDLDYKNSNALSGNILNRYGNASILKLPAPGLLASSHEIALDGGPPTISSLAFVTSDGDYTISENIDLSITFSETVTVDTTGGTPSIELETGVTDRLANYLSGSGTNILTFRYAVQAGDTNTDLDYKATSSLVLNSGTIKDTASNDATLTLPATGTLAAAHAVGIDTTTPSISGVAFATADGDYTAPSNVDLTVTFTESVIVNTTGGTPRVEFETGSTDRFANYLSGSGSNTLTFRYAIQAGDVNFDLDYKATTSLSLNSGTIKDSANNDATLTLPAVGTLAGVHEIGAGIGIFAWDFTTSGNYSFNTNYVEVTGGQANLKTVDQTHSGTDFNSGTHVGTYLDSESIMTLRSKYPPSISNSLTSILSTKTSSLVAYWPLDGDYQDASGNGYHGTPSSAGLSFIEGQHDEALSFNNTDYVENMPYLDLSGGDFTITSWIKSSSDGTGTIVSTSRTGGTVRWMFFKSSGSLRFLLSGSYSHDTGAVKVPIDGNFHFAAVRLQSGTLDFFLDGLNIATFGGLPNIPAVTGDGTEIGRDASTGTFPSSDILDEVSLWRTSLTDDEILKVYNQQKKNYTELSSSWTPKYSNIVGYWKMDGNWQDSSGNGNHATNTGDIAFSSDNKIGSQSATLDGVGDRLSISSVQGDLNFESGTLSGWFKRETNTLPGTFRYFFRFFSSGTNWINFQYNATSFNFSYRGNGNIQVCSENIPPDLFIPENKWVYITTSWNLTKSEMKVYANGVLFCSMSSFTDAVNAAFIYMLLGSDNITDDNDWSGKYDDIAFWDTDLSEAELKLIYNRQKQKYAGHYESPVIDLGSSGAWSNLNTLTSLPFGKEIVAQNSESSSDYSSLSGDLSSGLVGYWKMNETSVNSVNTGANDLEDFSGNSYFGDEIGGATFGTKGLVKNAVTLDGTDDYLSFGNQALHHIAADLTLSIWIKPYSISSGPAVIMGKHIGSAQGYWLRQNNSDVSIFGANNGNTTAASILEVGKWTHISGVRVGTTLKVYINGKELGSIDHGGSPNVNTSSPLTIGRRSSVALEYFNGLVDEAAIWSRALTASEIQQLYRRGANRIKYQVKSCVDSACNCKSFNTSPVGSATDCDGDGNLNTVDNDDIFMAEFIGPGGNGSTSYSELFNRAPADITATCTLNTTDSDNDICMDDEITLSGDTLAAPPSFTFSNMAASASPVNNRYFQYRVNMEAEENTACAGEACMPELESVEIGPVGRYYGGSPVVTPSTPISYSDINSITFTESGSCALSYQLSPDGSTFYYWNGSNWVTAGSETVSLSSSSSDINSNITSFKATAGTGSLYFKTFMTSDTAQNCSLDQIQIRAAQ